MRVRERIPLGALLKILLVVFPRAHRVPRWSKLFWLFYLVGVGCFGYISHSTSPELTVLVTFRVLNLPRRRVD